MRSYIRHDPKTVEEKLAAGYTLAQIGALAMLHDQAEQQPERGRFKSMALLVASMDCMVEEHGPKARVSQHIPFLMDREEVVKLDAGGYYVTGWDELQEGDHSPQARMELVRGRRGRPGDQSSAGAQRQRQYRARKGVTNHVTNPDSDASPSEPTSDGDVTADSDASPAPRTRDLDRQQQKAVAEAGATAEAVVTSAVTPMPLSPEVVGRVEEIREGCLEVLAARPLKRFERDFVQGWASTLRRDGELVPVDEILGAVRRKMAQPTQDGSPAANLGWCADDVAALARKRAGPSRPPSLADVADAMEAANGAPLRLAGP